MKRRRPGACSGTLSILMLTVVAGFAACSPALNWREVEGVSAQRWWFPCKPERVDRQVSVQGHLVPARLSACDAQGVTWSNLALQFASPAEAAAALGPARTTLMMNLRAEETAPPQGLAGAVDGPLWLAGHRAGGEGVSGAARFRVEGRWLVQQVMLTQGGPAWPRMLDAGALNTFFEGAFARP